MVFWGTAIYGERPHTACVLPIEVMTIPKKFGDELGGACCEVQPTYGRVLSAWRTIKFLFIFFPWRLSIKPQLLPNRWENRRLWMLLDVFLSQTFSSDWSVPVKQETTSCTCHGSWSKLSLERGNVVCLIIFFSIYPPVT